MGILPGEIFLLSGGNLIRSDFDHSKHDLCVQRVEEKIKMVQEQ